MIEERTELEKRLDDAIQAKARASWTEDPQPLARYCSTCGSRMRRRWDGLVVCPCGRIRFS